MAEKREEDEFSYLKLIFNKHYLAEFKIASKSYFHAELECMYIYIYTHTENIAGKGSIKTLGTGCL